MSDKMIVEKINTDSVEVSKNAKGEFSWKIKVYDDLKTADGAGVLQTNLEQAMVSVHTTLNKK